ncbi:WW domain binding protein 11 [Metarhizium album ARSEF 1941]|uniref:WW domain binding protein 11 n=1 Tax=Metarhizium album (strain ARSEF 1941) TaxID=1081103 RepID=A0A0B2WXJ5_METAS|nr:WW domain binding protein 11 [Metarhizium album ARSEF 1941]KHN98738.1 WW domain binding protein 11 [Metarhizium album ARSEF 1941]
MPKEKGYNPVQAQRKAEKAKAIKKGKAEAQDRRNERLARKNPDRIQKQIDDLKAIAAGGGKLSRHEEQLLEGLEKEFRGVRKAREILGDRAPSFNRGGRREGSSGVLGKRRRNSAGSSTDEDVPEEVRRIPMPRDTPPPISKEVLDQWYARRRARRNPNADAMREDMAKKEESQRTEAPSVQHQTVYEAKPVMRDLRQEAVSAFVPAAVQRKLNKGRGRGGLMEPEEADQLEKEGYLNPTKEAAGSAEDVQRQHLTATVEDIEDEEE